MADGHDVDRWLLLVRPDAYLALVADAEGWPALLAWLRRWLPRAN